SHPEYAESRIASMHRRWKLSRKQFAEIARRYSDPDEELPEQSVVGTDLVEAHLVDEFLEDERVIGEKIDTPLPVVEADRPGDDLPHRARVTAAHRAMLFHLPLALFDRQTVPVLLLATAPVHGIKAEVAGSRDLRKKSRTHGFALAMQRVLDRL